LEKHYSDDGMESVHEKHKVWGWLTMGTYGITKEDMLDDFEKFLRDQEGDVHAITVVECWNELAKKYDWQDNLKAINKFSKKEINI